MATINLVDNVMGTPSVVKGVSGPLIDFLVSRWPDGFNQPVEIYLNGLEIPVDKYDVELLKTDKVAIVFKPAASAVAGVLVSVVVSYVIGQIFGDQVPEPTMPDSSFNNRSVKNPQSIYSLTENNNSFATGQPVPIIYGTVRTTPSLIAPPYRTYEDNEQYLYQLFCLGQGDMAVDELLLADARFNSLTAGDVLYETIKPSDLVSTNVTDYIRAKSGDSLYSELVKTVDSVSQVELRGTPSTSQMFIKLYGSTIEFGPYYSGAYPDLSSLTVGSSITLAGCQFSANDGTYTVATIDIPNHLITVSTGAFTTEPNISDTNTTLTQDNKIIEGPSSLAIYNISKVGYPYNIVVNGVDNGTFWVTAIWKFGGIPAESKVTYNHNFSTQGTYSTTATQLYSLPSVTFLTSYGPYTLGDFVFPAGLAPLIYDFNGAEVDFELPQGLYTSSGGAFTSRTVTGSIDIILSHSVTLLTSTLNFPFSFTEQENTPFRKTVRCAFIVNFPAYDSVRVSVRRTSAEPSDTASKDQIFLKAVKATYKSDTVGTDFGNVTLLWTRTKATNAISATGANRINAWVTRSDVDNDISSVITDIYTNTEYGGALPAANLNLPTTTETLNGAFENEINLIEAMKTAARAGRYVLQQEGKELSIRKDEVQADPVAFFNETNIIRDSVKVAYSFGAIKDIDGYRVTYRSSSDFKEAFEIYPATSTNPEVLEMWGVTSSAIALAEATYQWKQYIYKRGQIEFQTEYEGFIPTYMDKILVAHSLFKTSQASEIVSASIPVSGSRDIVLADTVDGAPNQLVIRDANGAPSEYVITGIADNVVTVTMLDTVVLSTDVSVSERSKVSLGTATTMTKEYIVSSARHVQDDVISITAINYDERVYA